MDSDYDIYGDLSTTDVSTCEEIEKLRQQNAHLQELIQSLEADIEKLCARISEMKKTQDNLAKNISELFKTAKAEIERKDRTIAELRSQVEELQMEKRNRLMGVKRERSASSHRSSSDSNSKRVKYEDYVKRHRRSPSLHRRSRSRSREKLKHFFREQSKTHDRIKDKKPNLSAVHVASKALKVESKIVGGTYKKAKKVEELKYATKESVTVNYKEHKFVTSLKQADCGNGFQSKVEPVTMKLDKSDCKNKKIVGTISENSKIVPRVSLHEKIVEKELDKPVNEDNDKQPEDKFVGDKKQHPPTEKKNCNEKKHEKQSGIKVSCDKNGDTFEEKKQPPPENNNEKQSETKVGDEKNSGTFKESTAENNNEKQSETKVGGTFKEKKRQSTAENNEIQSEKNVGDEKNSHIFEEKKQPTSGKNEEEPRNEVSHEKNSDTLEERKQTSSKKNEKQSENKVSDEKNSEIFEEKKQPPCEKNEKQSGNKVGDGKNSDTFEGRKQTSSEKNEKQSEDMIIDEKISDTSEEKKQPTSEENDKQPGKKVGDEINSVTFEEKKQPPTEQESEKQLGNKVGDEKKQTEKKRTSKLKIEDVTTKLKQRLNENSKREKKIAESKEKKNDEQVKQPEITENKKPKKVKETKAKKDKCDEEIPESGRILRSATRRNSSREKLEVKKQETSPSVVLSDLESIDRMSLTHEGEIPTLHISDNEHSPCSSRSLFDLSSSHTVSSSPVGTKTVDMQLLKEDLNISLDQSPIESFVSSKSDSAISPNTSSARKRRRYLVTLI